MAIATDYAYIDGAHHKQWVITEMVKALIPDTYNEWAGDDWDKGIAP